MLSSAKIHISLCSSVRPVLLASLIVIFSFLFTLTPTFSQFENLQQDPSLALSSCNHSWPKNELQPSHSDRELFHETPDDSPRTSLTLPWGCPKWANIDRIRLWAKNLHGVWKVQEFGEAELSNQYRILSLILRNTIIASANWWICRFRLQTIAF